jgi:phage/plasmid-associated DNA primase
MYKIYNLPTYKSNGKGSREDLATKGSINTIVNVIETTTANYHELVRLDSTYKLFGDLDFQETKDDNIIVRFGDILIQEINKNLATDLQIGDFKYTQNNGKIDKKTGLIKSSFHWSIPQIAMNLEEQRNLFIKIYNENYEKFHDVGIVVNKSYGEFLKKKIDADFSHYASEHTFRLPNQMKEGKTGTEHIIKNGQIKDFILQYVQESELKSFTEKHSELNVKEEIQRREKEKKEKEKEEKQKEKDDKKKEKKTEKEEESSQEIRSANIIEDKKKIVEQFIEKCYSYQRSSDYDTWIKFGICCKNSFNKDDAIFLWKEFSKIDMNKFNETDFEKQFEYLKSNDGYSKKLSIWSLFYWAKKDNYEEYKNITLANFVNLDQLLNHTEIPKLVKEFSPDTFIWKKTIINLKDYWTMFYFNGIKWSIGEEGFREYISNDLYKKLKELYIDNLESETKKKLLLIKLDKLKNSTFKTGCLTESKSILKNEHLEFDKNIYLLGFNNCVIDLETCKARMYRYDDFITFSTGWDLDYNKETGNIITNEEKRVEVETLLKSIHRKDAERKFWLEVLSSGLDGKAYQKIFIFTGFGGNGKGCINDFVCLLLGDDYAKGNIKSTLISNELKEGANPELAVISKKRFITFQEPEKKKKLNNSTLKELTGGGKTISARGCFSNDVNTYLNMSLIIECNERPLLKEKAGNSMKRRLEILEFESNFTEIEEDINNVTHFKADNKYTSEAWRNDHKQEFLQILLENYKDLQDRNYEFLNLESSKKQCETYIQNSDLVLNWFSLNFKKVPEKDEKGRNVLISLDEIYEEFKLSEVFESLSKKEKAEFTRKEFYDNFRTKPNFKESQRIKKKIDGVLKVVEYTNILLGIQKEEKKECFKVVEDNEDDQDCLVDEEE